MYCSAHLRVPILSATMLLASFYLKAQTPPPSNTQTDSSSTIVNLRWVMRPGVSRYRLQLARDIGFADIVFDRAVNGNERQISDLPPGNYYWRIAPLTTRLGEFSSAGVIEVRTQTASNTSRARPADGRGKASSGIDPNSMIVAGGGWRTAIGDITYPVPGHFRSQNRFDIIGVNSEGTTFALDSVSGVSLWTARLTQRNSMRGNDIVIAPLIIKARSGLDNVIVVSGTTVTKIEGATGRELWRAALPVAASGGTVMEASRGPLVFILDNSLQRIMLLDGKDGNIVSQIRLPRRVVGAPTAFVDQRSQRVLLAYADGRIEVRDETGAVVRTGDAGSAVTTTPLFVEAAHGGLVIVGTKNGLTAMSADDLRPLGRVTIKDDAPRGTLAAADLNGDGAAEVIMFTERGRVIAVSAADGQILWNTDVGSEVTGITFADVNGDGAVDVVLATSQLFALALSGRDGSILWKDSEDPGLVANHAVTLAPRSIVAVPFGSGALLIAGDASRTGLRAVEFSRGSVRSKH